MQRRYKCAACDQDMLVAHCEAPEGPKDCGSVTASADDQAPLNELGDYERKIAALESQLARIDQEIANSQQIADKQEFELMQAKLGVGDLRNLDAVTAKHTHLLTLLNELHRMHYSQALVNAQTEHEKDQLESCLEAVKNSSAETESILRAELESIKESREVILRENQVLKQRTLSLECELREATAALAETRKERDAALSRRKTFITTSSANTALAECAEAPAINEEYSAASLAEQPEPASAQTTAIEEHKIGVRYIRGEEVKRSEQKAIEHFEKAAHLGHTSAQHNLGVLQYKGTQDVRDLKSSVFWLSKAASQGHQKAISLLPEVEAAYQMYDRNIAV